MQPFTCCVSKLSREGRGGERGIGWVPAIKDETEEKDGCLLLGEQGYWELAQGWEQRERRREEQ